MTPARPGTSGQLLAALIVAFSALLGAVPAVAGVAHGLASTPHGSVASAPVSSPSLSSSVAPPVTAAGSSISPNLAAPSWNLLATRGGPVALAYTAWSWDPNSAGEILFGGTDGATTHSDTYLFQQGTWTRLTGSLTTAPSARYANSMVYDAHDNYLVLFGGRGLKGTTTFFMNDTWVYNTTGWHNLTSTAGTAPSPRAYYQMLYDTSLNAVVLFGGGFASGKPVLSWKSYADTWEFSGGTWTNVTASVGTAPPPTVTASTSWDPVDNLGIMTGGAALYSGCPNYNTTWTFGSTGWTNVSSSLTNPGNFSSGGASFDSIDGYLVDFGGWDSTPASKTSTCTAPSFTWTYVGGAWTNYTSIQTGTTPAGRFGDSVTYDPLMKDVVVFGGAKTGKSNTYVSDLLTWPAAPIAGSITVPATEIPVDTSLSYILTFTGGLGPFNFNWSWGDATTNATTQNASHTFTSTGTFTVNVRIVDAQLRSFNTSVVVIVVPHLTALASEFPIVGEAPLKVQFNASYAGGVPAIYTLWSFGDRSTSGTRNLTHTYNAAGVYNVSFRVNDSATELIYINSTVTVYSKITGTMTPTTIVGAAPYLLAFSANGSLGLGPYSYTWDFGDGTANVTGQNVTHTFAAQGNYTVSVLITDSLSYTYFTSAPATIYPGLAFTIDPSTDGRVPPPVSVTFTATGGGGVPTLSYVWNYGDGSSLDTGIVVSHTFSVAGTYTVTLTVTDANNDTTTATTTIYVINPLAGTVAASDSKGPTPLVVNFTGNATGGIPGSSGYTYAWSFGDGSTGAGVLASHTYRALGNFTARVTIGDSLGDSATASIVITTYTPLAVRIAANPTTFVLNNSTTLTATATYGQGPRTYLWFDLPTGCSSRNASVLACTPTAAGVWNTTVSVADTAGDLANATIELTITSPTSTGPGGPGNGGGNTSGSSSGFPTVYYALILAIIVVAAILIVLLARRGGGGAPDAAESDEAMPAEDGGEGSPEIVYGMQEPAEAAPEAVPDEGQIYGEQPPASDEYGDEGSN